MEEELDTQEIEQSDEMVVEEDVAADEPAVTAGAGEEADAAGDSPAPATESPGSDGWSPAGYDEDSAPKATPRRLYPTFTAGPAAGSRPKSGRGATEFKAGPFVVKGIEGRTVTGIFSVFGVLDTQVDVIHPGAFLKTIRERGGRALHLWQHDFWSPPTAVIRELREIGIDELPDAVRAEWPEATGGVLVKREYLDTPRGNEILAALKAGSPLQMSFGYDPVRYDFEETEDVGRIRHLREVRLWETSDVLWGANEATVANTAALAVPFETLVRQLEQHLGALKEGRRNAATDQERINTIARLAVELGADNVKLADSEPLAGDDGDEDEDKSVSSDTPPVEQRRAGAAESAPPLTLLAAELSLLELETFV